jgi:hypothetical protein
MLSLLSDDHRNNVTMFHDYVVERRRFPVGVVLGGGQFTSLRNKLLNRDGTAKTQQVQAKLFEATFNIKAHPAIDVGVGLGVTRYNEEPPDHPDGPYTVTFAPFWKFHLVPASVVFRPARLLCDHWLCDAVGMQFALRYLSGFTADDFNANFSTRGEFQLSRTLFVDLRALFAH